MAAAVQRIRRFAAALLGAAVVAGCSDSGTDNNQGSISLTLDQGSATVQQGNQTTVHASLTRSGGFTGTVNLTVTGAPTGVTATAGNVQTSGTTTTADITVTVASTVPAAVYPLVVHGNGTGVTEALANFQLTVTAAPAASYTLGLSSAALTIVQGTATPTTTVNIGRTNFPGDITLSVDNLPTGVTAAFLPANPQSGNSSVLTLTVAPTAATGTFANLAVHGTAAGLTDVTTPLSLTISAAAPTPAIALSLSSATLSIPQGGNAPTTTVAINRTSFPGDVTLSVDNLPTGVTAAFNPANPQSTNSSVLTLTVAPTAATGTFSNLAVRGTGTGITAATTPLTLTITAAAPVGNFSLTTTPATNASVTQGNSTPVTVNIVRTGGNASDVTLTATGTLPTGLTLGFNPGNTTTNSSTLTVTTTGATPVGAVPIVIHGNATGLAEQTVNLTINVSAPGGSGNVTVNFSACAPADQPAWLAFMDGTAGTWTQVTGAANVFQFNVAQNKGSIAWVTTTGGSIIHVQHMTQAELTAGPLNFCGVATPAGSTINGTVANIAAGFTARISFGGVGATAAISGPFQVAGAPSGAHDLIGYMRQALLGTSDRVFVKRAETPVGGAFPTTVDFNDGTRSASSVAAGASLQGLVGGETTLVHAMTFSTGGTACEAALLYFGATVNTTFNIYGIPASLRTAGDMHTIGITVANGNTSFRLLSENFVDPVARAATPFILPAQLPVPVATDAGGPYKRPQVVVNPVPAEFNISHAMTYTDQTDVTKNGSVTATQGWVGGTNLTLVLPNFAGVGTFQNSWAPATGDALNWSVASSGGTVTGACTAGQRFVTASRSGTL